MVCIACNRLLSDKELQISLDYCRECNIIIAQDLLEWEAERIQRNKNEL